MKKTCIYFCFVFSFLSCTSKKDRSGVEQFFKANEATLFNLVLEKQNIFQLMSLNGGPISVPYPKALRLDSVVHKSIKELRDSTTTIEQSYQSYSKSLKSINTFFHNEFKFTNFAKWHSEKWPPFIIEKESINSFNSIEVKSILINSIIYTECLYLDAIISIYNSSHAIDSDFGPSITSKVIVKDKKSEIILSSERLKSYNHKVIYVDTILLNNKLIHLAHRNENISEFTRISVDSLQAGNYILSGRVKVFYNNFGDADYFDYRTNFKIK